jgi:mannose-6-phosphate isomerase-like protein (cupin superfamily)
MDSTRRMLFQSLPLGLAVLAADPAAWGAADQAIASFAIPFDKLPAKSGAGHVTRAICNGQTHSGAHLEVHETTLSPGAAPHPPHHHVSEEMFLVSRGTISVTIAGKRTDLGPGSAAFVHSGEEHGVHNPGPDPAQYFVVAIGAEA